MTKKILLFQSKFFSNFNVQKNQKKIKLKNTSYKKVKKINSYNTLIIDGEGIEKHYIENISVLNKIRFIFLNFIMTFFLMFKNQKFFKN